MLRCTETRIIHYGKVQARFYPYPPSEFGVFDAKKETVEAFTRCDASFPGGIC